MSRLILIGVMALCVGSCSAPPSATATPAIQQVTPAPRGTLPPTWTPSPTATITATPSATDTPTPVPTLSAADICAGFELLTEFAAERRYPWDGYIPLLASLPNRDTLLRFRATHRGSGDGTGFDLPGGQIMAVEVRVDALPRPGVYDWEIVVVSEPYGEICRQSGTFMALRPTPTPPPLTPEATEYS